MFVSFNAWKEGFLGRCRKFTSADGTHLNDAYKGVLLIAKGIDTKNHCFPPGYAIVDVKNKEN